MTSWHWPQYTYLALTLIGLGYVAAKHGEPRDDYDFVSTFMSTAFILSILCFGGFFG